MAIKDSYGKGVFFGLCWSAVAYASWAGFETLDAAFGPIPSKLRPPAFQFLLLAAALVVFRFMMVRWRLVRAGKAMFLVIFGVTLFAFLNFRFKIL